MMLFRRDELSVRELDEVDVPVMAHWLSDPRVLEYYEGRDRPHNEAMVREKYLSRRENDVTGCIVERAGAPICYIQFYVLLPEARITLGYGNRPAIYGIDLFIGEPELWNQGIGTGLVSAMVDFLFAQKRADLVIIDPNVGNPRAIRCYEKAGFHKVRVSPKHELYEGEMLDCWLMEKGREQSGGSREQGK